MLRSAQPRQSSENEPTGGGVSAATAGLEDGRHQGSRHPGPAAEERERLTATGAEEAAHAAVRPVAVIARRKLQDRLGISDMATRV